MTSNRFNTTVASALLLVSCATPGTKTNQNRAPELYSITIDYEELEGDISLVEIKNKDRKIWSKSISANVQKDRVIELPLHEWWEGPSNYQFTVVTSTKSASETLSLEGDEVAVHLKLVQDGPEKKPAVSVYRTLVSPPEISIPDCSIDSSKQSLIFTCEIFNKTDLNKRLSRTMKMARKVNGKWEPITFLNWNCNPPSPVVHLNFKPVVIQRKTKGNIKLNLCNQTKLEPGPYRIILYWTHSMFDNLEDDDLFNSSRTGMVNYQLEHEFIVAK